MPAKLRLRTDDRADTDVRGTSYPRRRFRSDAAEVGVGTLIIFIAMVLVAAVAAAVIIGTSGSLQQRAQLTGQEATQEVSSNMQVIGVTGFRNTTSNNIWDLRVLTTLAAGSQDVDMSQMLIRWQDNTTVRIYKYNTGSTTFNLTWIRGTGNDQVAKTGDLVQVQFNMTNTEVAPRARINFQMIPVVGAPVEQALLVPATFGEGQYIDIVR